MSNFENDILGFDPADLEVYNEAPAKSSNGNPLIYYTRPADSISEDGIYRSTIKIVYNPFDFRNSILEQQSYSMKDKDGYFSMVSKLTINDTNCPIFKAWKKCRYSEEKSPLWLQQAKKEEGGKALFDKRFTRYVTVQVIDDENQPELKGKFLFWKLPKSIWDIINAKMNPTDPKKAKIPVMDFLFGRSIDIEVIPGPDDKNAPERKTRETKYMGELSDDCVTCINPDGSSMLNDDEQEILDTYISAMNKVWKCKDPEERKDLNKAVNASENTKELKKIYDKVIDKIKQVCPNITEELGYKDPTPEQLARINNWIDIVLSGNDPAVVVDAPASISSIGTDKVDNAANDSDDDPFGNVGGIPKPVEDEDDNDDLPF